MTIVIGKHTQWYIQKNIWTQKIPFPLWTMQDSCCRAVSVFGRTMRHSQQPWRDSLTKDWPGKDAPGPAWSGVPGRHSAPHPSRCTSACSCTSSHTFSWCLASAQCTPEWQPKGRTFRPTFQKNKKGKLLTASPLLGSRLGSEILVGEQPWLCHSPSTLASWKSCWPGIYTKYCPYRDSLVTQPQRIRLPVQETWAWSLIWKDPWEWNLKSFSPVWLFATPWTIQPRELSRPEYWSEYTFPSPGGSSQLRDRTQVSCIVGGFFTSWATREVQEYQTGSLSLLQRIFPTQESNWGLLHCRQILYQVSYQGSPPLEKEMATHSSILAWKIPWTEEPGGLQSVGSQRVRHNLVAKQHNRLQLQGNCSWVC